MVVAWILGAWMCSGLGPSGDCRALPHEIYPSRGQCLAASKTQRRSDDRIVAHCRLHRIEELSGEVVW
jgi:hypothetical protein